MNNCTFDATEHFKYYFNEFCIEKDEVYWFDAGFVVFLVI